MQHAVDSQFQEASNVFADLENKYAELAAGYGDIHIVSSEDIYNDYLQNIETTKQDLGIEQKLDAIKNTDLSVHDLALKEEYEQAKFDAADALHEAQMTSQAIVDKFTSLKEQQEEKQSQLEQERIEAAEIRYNNIAAGYDNVAAQAAQAGSVSSLGAGSNIYHASDLAYLANAMGINFDEAVTAGKLGLLENFGIGILNDLSKLFGSSNGNDLYSAMNR